MLQLTDIKLPLAHTQADLVAAICRRLRINASQLRSHAIHRRAVDARRRDAIAYIYTLHAEVADEPATLARIQDRRRINPAPDLAYRLVTRAPSDLSTRPIVIGTGPCGLFAGLLLAQMGFKPILLERGKPVRQRTVDTFAFWRGGPLNGESNVQFGEGGAGTFSDGKLHTQIKDPHHHGRKVLEEFVKAGAPPEILYLAKPHIGTFRLVGIVEHLRNTIESLGGEIRFQSRVTDLLIEQGRVRAVLLADGSRIDTDHVLLAVGHSARDTFQMLHARGVAIEPKPFSVGFRIEHPQALIDRCQYGPIAGNPELGAANYKLVHHCANGRSVYTFCMCPGGTVVAAASEPGCVVTNGMSQYSRNERNANSGLVVGITPEDFNATPENPLAGIDFQRHWEHRAYELGGSNYQAPAQLVGDFLAGRPSTQLGSVLPSYIPGVHLCDLSTCLPPDIIAAIREAIPAFGKKIRGFDMPDALLTAVETRTSSPIRLPRDENYQSQNTRGLYPAGEGAGHAGGILSAAIDGLKSAEAIALSIAPGEPERPA
ncbi:MAG: NAD(P)/FAD-dependent oxidoreductase [Phycisphaerales bacterium]